MCSWRVSSSCFVIRHPSCYSCSSHDGSYLYKGIYANVSLEWVDLFSFQIYDRVVNCPLQYINGRGFSNYNISLGHISTNQNSCFIAKAMFDEFCVVMSVKISEKKTIFGSSLPQVVCRRDHVFFYLRYLCLLAHSGGQRILCCVFVLFFYVASVSGLSIFDCPFGTL